MSTIWGMLVPMASISAAEAATDLKTRKQRIARTPLREPRRNGSCPPASSMAQNTQLDSITMKSRRL